MTAGAREGAIVFGAPRSGTTLLRRLLNAHPEFACPGETNLFVSCGRFLGSEVIADGIDVGVVSGLGFAGFAEQDVHERLRTLAFGFMREHAAREGKPRWVEKTAFNAFYIDALEQLCGTDVHYICLLRHGLDVSASLQDLRDVNDRYLAEIHDYVRRYPRPLEAFAHVWADLTTSILAFAARNRANSVTIRYEDLVARPDEVMERVCAALGTEWRPEYGAAALQDRRNVGLGDWKTYSRSSIDSGSVQRWKQMPRTTIGRLAPIVNPALAAAGYDAVDAVDQPDAEEARRRYELGLMLQAMRPANPGS